MKGSSSVLQRNIIQDKIHEIGEADIIVGIPSYNNAGTIGHVVRAVQAGLTKYFPDKKAVLINSDGGSRDGTMDVVHETGIDDHHSILLAHRVSPVFKIAAPYHGIPGKGSAFRSIFEIARALGAKACAVVDSDLRSITPEWIELLVKPLMEKEFDYVSPLYHRHKYDGTITNGIIYPLTRALYGKRIRQPIGGDFGFSGELAGFFLSKDVWETDVARYGIDIWMTTTAVANGFKVCQSFLGAKIHDPKDPGADLSDMLYQVVGSVLDLMETYHDSWSGISSSEPVPSFGFQYAVGVEPVSVDIDRMIGRFSLGAKELMGMWESFLPPAITGFLSDMSGKSKEHFHIPDEIWVDAIYEFALTAHRKQINKEHLLKSLTPLYIGRTASFVIQTWNSDPEDVEKKIESLCGVFEEKKKLLIQNWSGGNTKKKRHATGKHSRTGAA